MVDRTRIDPVHIDVLIHTGLVLGHGLSGRLSWSARGQPRHELTPRTATRTGAMLLAQHWRSQRPQRRARGGTRVPPYEYRWVPGQPDPVIVLKALDSYESHAATSEDWPDGEAHAFCTALRAACIRTLPGYADAPWVITDRSVFLPTRWP